ncbi:hypothetical protein VKT23_016783 [Stygiomarasmius scandens]|uniref:non-specific serine/threonine protein kinase n=1 Tax=Marasmiellus scandens TaxID=2682957 RepID=A0ABR1IXA4_9AGAR
MSNHATRILVHWGTSDEVEDISRYVAGGYHPVKLGDILKSNTVHYRILHKLGRGSFATVWLARTLGDTYSSPDRLVALKICVADTNADHEIEVHSRLPPTEGQHVLPILHKFSLHGPNGTHVIIVYDVLGSITDTPDLIRKQARQICRQIVQGVAFLHNHGVTHGDIHTGNIGIRLPTLEKHSEDDILNYFGPPEISPILTRQPLPQADALPPYLTPSIPLACYFKERDALFAESSLQVEIIDLGSAQTVDEFPCLSCTPAAVCAPEIMFKRVALKTNGLATFASDIWSLACTLYEIVFGTRTFYSAFPNDSLLVDMARLCGEIPLEWSTYWESIPQLKCLNGTISQTTADVNWKSQLDYFERNQATGDNLAQFIELLRDMLKMDPVTRPSAVEVLRHPWFSAEDGSLRKDMAS